MHNVLPYPGHLQRHCMLLKRKSNENFSPLLWTSTIQLYRGFSHFIMYPFAILWSPHFPLCIFNLFPFLQILFSQFFTPFPATISLSTHLYLSLLLYQASISHDSLIPFPFVYYFPFCLIPTFFFQVSSSCTNIKICIWSLRPA